MKKVGLVSLGCNKNLVDSENILGLLDKNNYEITSNPKDADIIIINSCGFIESSKKESLANVFEMLSYGKKVVLTGCLAERYEKELKKDIPELAQIIPIRDYYHFNELLSSVDEDLHNNEGVSDEYRIVSTGPFSAYLKIGEGCDNCCSYCAIPLIRGHFVSRDFDSIIQEATSLAASGIEEIVILEQDTTRYGSDLKVKKTIVDLLKELLKIKSFKFIRLFYLYPDEISDELIDLIGKEERLTPYFDIPIQHSEDHILKGMHRRGNKEFLLKLFKKIKSKVPNAVLRTTVMVGFPSETDEDIVNLKEFMSEVQFDHLGVFTYSREEDTPSYNYDGQIIEEIKNKRKDEIMRHQQTISYRKNKKHIGEIMSGFVLKKENDLYLLRSYWNAPDDIDGNIYFSSSKELNVGDFVKVKINDAYVYDLMGELVEDL